MKKKLEIHLTGGWTDIWDAENGEFDDYSYDGTALIIKKKGEMVGLYNMSSIICAALS